MSPDTQALNPELNPNGSGGKRNKTPMRIPSRLEEQFEKLWIMFGGPTLKPEYRFDERRKWRADFAHLDSRTLIEIEGGIHSGGRHVRGLGYEADCKKYNAATMQGWRVIRLTANMIQPDEIERLIEFVEANA